MKKLRIPKSVVKLRKLAHSHFLQRFRVHKICLSGGPCSGKTTGKQLLFDLLIYMMVINSFAILEETSSKDRFQGLLCTRRCNNDNGRWRHSDTLDNNSILEHEEPHEFNDALNQFGGLFY